MAAPDQPWLRISMPFSCARVRTTSQTGLSKKSTYESANLPAPFIEKPMQETRGRSRGC